MVWSQSGGGEQGLSSYVAVCLSLLSLVRLPLLLGPHPLALRRRAVILLMVPVVVLVEMTRVCREVWLELPLLSVGKLQHVRDLHYLRLHEDGVCPLPVAVHQVQLGLTCH